MIDDPNIPRTQLEEKNRLLVRYQVGRYSVYITYPIVDGKLIEEPSEVTIRSSSGFKLPLAGDKVEERAIEVAKRLHANHQFVIENPDPVG
jgi:hypothetical protein